MLEMVANIVVGRGENDVVDAASAVATLKMRCGVAKMTVGVLRLNRKCEPPEVKGKKLKNIRAMHQRVYKYENQSDGALVCAGVRIRRQSNMGVGKFYSLADLQKLCPNNSTTHYSTSWGAS
jgi:hypothetical protein